MRIKWAYNSDQKFQTFYFYPLKKFKILLILSSSGYANCLLREKDKLREITVGFFSGFTISTFHNLIHLNIKSPVNVNISGSKSNCSLLFHYVQRNTKAGYR